MGEIMAGYFINVPGAGSGNPYVDSLIWGNTIWDTGNEAIKVWLGDSRDVNAALQFHGDDPNLPNVQDWTQPEVDAFIKALTVYVGVCNIRFAAANSVEEANIVWWKADLGPNLLGQHEVPSADRTSWGFFNPVAASWQDLTPGGDGFNTIVHELGHGLGLAHPHDGGTEDDRTTFPGVEPDVPSDTGDFGLNQSVWTVMSYNRGWNGAPFSINYGCQGGLGAFDIATMQALYGVNETSARGNDTYRLPSRNATGTGWMCIWDTAGTDTISGTTATGSVTIDLRAATLAANDPHAGGFVSWQLRIGGGFTIAKGVVIENATGGSYSDKLYGNGVANTLRGNGGVDTLVGGAGNDTLYGGAGNDTFYGGSGRDLFVFNTAPSGKTNRDRIGDWDRASDTIQLENAVFKKLSKTGVLNKAYFVLGAAAKDSNDFVGYNKITGDVWYDSNGSAAGGQVAFANIGKNKSIAYNDFIVV